MIRTRPAVSAERVPTATRALDVAERLIQTLGYNGFSYADIAAELGVTKATLHFHHATKEHLGVAIIERYRERFLEALKEIRTGRVSVRAQLGAYVQLYADTLRGQRLCLCGMLAAEYQTLPSSMQRALRGFFDANEEWLADRLAAGRRSGVLTYPGSATQEARALTAALEGAMLLARPYQAIGRFNEAARSALRALSVPSRSRAASG
jgi:TetR/AcrR family transcriptional regulator, transcriptional repressor for nem operon